MTWAVRLAEIAIITHWTLTSFTFTFTFYVKFFNCNHAFKNSLSEAWNTTIVDAITHFFISAFACTIDGFVAYIYAVAFCPSLPALPTSCQYCRTYPDTPQCITILTSEMFTPKPNATVHMTKRITESDITKCWRMFFLSLDDRRHDKC